MFLSPDEIAILTAACRDRTNPTAVDLVNLLGTNSGKEIARAVFSLPKEMRMEVEKQVREAIDEQTRRADWRRDRSMPQEPSPLSTEELHQLILLVGDRSSATGRDVLAFTGARSGAGIVAKIMIAEPAERRVLLLAVRHALEQARDQV